MSTPATYCHHCHRKCDPATVLKCSNVRPGKKQACQRTFCERDLVNRYNEVIPAIRTSWACPCCRQTCKEAGCHKKREGGSLQKAKPVPVFEKIDTTLSREEVEDRIFLREYLFRFRGVLAIPERCLPAVDDFDRPLTEANVRAFAGAMLDACKEDDLTDVLFRPREELRYYADLARFASIYKELAEPLELRTMSAGPRASRMPSPPEVVSMLCALAERTMTTTTIRNDMDADVQKGDYAKAIKAEAARWEKEQKKLSAAMLQDKGLEKMREGLKAHTMRVKSLELEMASATARRALRYQALHTDQEGRVYYLLSPRVIDDRAPIGWASGLLVWGRGMTDQEDLPASVERWSHFGTSKGVEQLGTWLGTDIFQPVIDWLQVLEWAGQGE